VISARYDFVLLYDVENGNPNGDPDAGNMPRLDPETMHGLVSDVALKRKIRDYVYMRYFSDQAVPGMDIFVKHGAILNDTIDRARSAGKKAVHESGEPGAGHDMAEAAGRTGAKAAEKAGTPKRAGLDRKQRDAAREFMCETYYDVRTFGAVMTTGGHTGGAGQVRGPVQLTFSRSVDPIVPLDISLTRVALTKPEDATEASSEGTMGRKHLVPYALYRAHGFISYQFAKQTGFSESDLGRLWEALENMFEFDRSAARGTMSSRLLCIFKHESPYGNAPAHRLFDAVQVRRALNANGAPARTFSDYEIRIDRAKIPEGVTLELRPELQEAA